MEQGSLVAPEALRARGCRPLCRNFARGFCRWGQSCRFSHDGKRGRICRYFQNGFCWYGEQCSYEHVQEEPVALGTRYGPVSPNRWDSEPRNVPAAVTQDSGRPWNSGRPRDSGRPRHGSARPVPSAMHMAFKFPNVEVEEEETHKENIPAPENVRRGAISREFVSARARGARGSQLPRLGLAPHSLDTREAAVETSRWTDREVPAALGAAAAPVPTAVLRARSEAVVCGICMDRVYEKALPEERLFGILPNCSHVYCLGCIRKWRRSRDFQSGVVKACPECRVISNFYIPHKYWVSDASEKEKLIETFKARTRKIRCKFFVQNRGCCPFESECIYLHELPPGRPRRRRRQRPRMPVFSPSPSESSDEEDDDLEWAFSLSLMESGFWYMRYGYEMLFMDSSDSD